MSYYIISGLYGYLKRGTENIWTTRISEVKIISGTLSSQAYSLYLSEKNKSNGNPNPVELQTFHKQKMWNEFWNTKMDYELTKITAPFRHFPPETRIEDIISWFVNTLNYVPSYAQKEISIR